MLRSESNAVSPDRKLHTSILGESRERFPEKRVVVGDASRVSSWKEAARSSSRRRIPNLGLGVIRETVCHSSCQFRIRMKSARGIRDARGCASTCRLVQRQASLRSRALWRIRRGSLSSPSALVTPSWQRETAGSPRPRLTPASGPIRGGVMVTKEGGIEETWNIG